MESLAEVDERRVICSSIWSIWRCQEGSFGTLAQSGSGNPPTKGFDHRAGCPRRGDPFASIGFDRLPVPIRAKLLDLSLPLSLKHR